HTRPAPTRPDTAPSSSESTFDLQPSTFDLPAVPPASDLSSPPLHWAWTAAVFLLTFAFYVALLPPFLPSLSPPPGHPPHSLNVFLFAHELTGKLWIALAVWLPLAFSNPIMSYSYMIFTELPTGLLAIYAVRRLALGSRANGPYRLALIGFCIAFIPWLAWRC